MKLVVKTAVGIALWMFLAVYAQPAVEAGSAEDILGSSGFKSQLLYAVGKGADGVEIGDINEDGKNDLVVANRISRNLTVFSQTGNPVSPLQMTQERTVGWSPAVLSFADINRDSHDDVVIAHYDDYVGGGKTNTFGVCYQDTTTHLLLSETNYTFPSGKSSRAIAAGDINSDGFAEVVVANEVTGNSVFIWSWNTTSASLENSAEYSPIYSAYIISISIGDVTGDGKNDVAIYGSNLYVLEQDTSGKLKTPKNYGSTGGESGDIGDLNSDGLNDVAGATAHSGEMDVWLQDSSTHALAKDAYSPYNCGGYTEDTEITDLNSDGHDDVVIASRDLSEAYIFYQNTTTHLLMPPVKYVSLPDKWLNELAVGDLNSDGATDIAGSNWGDNTVGDPSVPCTWVSIWLQNVTGVPEMPLPALAVSAGLGLMVIVTATAPLYLKRKTI